MGWTAVVRFPAGAREFLLYSTALSPTLGPTQPPIQWAPGALSQGVERPRREADHSPQSSTDGKNGVQGLIS
jgi:hypothetical protein